MITSAGQVIINAGLPPDLRDYSRQLNKNGIKELLRKVAEKYPDQYKKVLRNLMEAGRSFSSTTGASVSLRHLRANPRIEAIKQTLRAKNQQDISNPELDDEEKRKRIVARTSKAYDKLKELAMEEGERSDSPYWKQVKSGGRGNPGQLASLVAGDMLVSDHKGDPAPFPVLNSYSSGLDPAEFWASTYGTRKGLIGVKFSVADSGFLSKQLGYAAHRQVVTDEKPQKYRNPVGLPVDVDDPDNEGAALAYDYPPYKSGTILTPKILQDLRKDHRRILIHSPMTSFTEDGGIDQLSAGRRERGVLAQIGDNVGITAAQAIGEPMSQGMLSCLVEGTEVRMADGSVREIQQLRPGDMVLGSDIEGRTFPTKVNHLFDNGVQGTFRTIFRIGDKELELLSTLRHKCLAILVYNYPHAESLLNGQKRVVQVGKIDRSFRAVLPDGAGYALMSGQEYFSSVRRTFDIEVDHPDHLFVLANGLIVSNSKHTSGADDAKVSRGGFEYINRLFQAPESFAEAAPMSHSDGYVGSVEEAPQGGWYVHIGSKKYHIPPGQEPKVKSGQKVSRGDLLSDGVPHPKELVRFHGVGGARAIYLKYLMEAFKNSEVQVNRRNAEVIAAAAINHAAITNPDGMSGHLVDDVVPANTLFANYQPREGSQRLPVDRSMGKYLEEPVLHYTPGTYVNNNVLADLREFGIKDVETHDDEPDFEPRFERLMTNMTRDPDWQTGLSGFYTGRAFQQAVQRGATSDYKSTSFFPALARGTDFGEDLEVSGQY